jgi:hypothetical protein
MKYGEKIIIAGILLIAGILIKKASKELAWSEDWNEPWDLGAGW